MKAQLCAGSFALMMLAAATGVQAQSRYVSVTGDNGNDGSATAPFATIQAAILSGATDILVESGQYIIQSQVFVPPNTRVRGGFKRNGADWFLNSEPTIILLTAVPATASFVLQPATDEQELVGGMLENLIINGGFATVEMGAGSILRDVELGGGSNVTVFVNQGTPDLPPALIESCEIRGGGNGVRVTGTGRLAMLRSTVRGTSGIGLDVRGSGLLQAEHSVFQSNSIQGVLVTDHPAATFKNCTFRRNLSDGLRVVRSTTVVTGCFSELNERGISISESPETLILNSTIAANRQAGALITRSQTNLIQNLFIYNTTYGVLEEQREIVEGQPAPPPVVGRLDRNLFFGNGAGEYGDEAQFVYNTAEDINGSTVNRVAAEGNLVADPLIVSREKNNFRLTPGSPAIDYGFPVTGDAVDFDANPRIVDVPNVGRDDADAIDLGAWEHQGDRIVHGFGTEYYDVSYTYDYDNPTVPAEVRRNPIWEFNPVAVYKDIRGWLQPGRIRLASSENESFGFTNRVANDIKQPAGKIGHLRLEMSAPVERNRPTIRLRFNWADEFHVANMLTIEGILPEAPPIVGRTYDLFFDLQQHGFRDLPAGTLPTYNTFFFTDFIDFQGHTAHTPLDVTHMEVDFIDRALFEAQFTNLVKEWDFATNQEGFTTATIPDPQFAAPTFVYNPTRQAIEFQQIQDFTFGIWTSPFVVLQPGKLFMVEFTVSSSRPIESTTNFRTRFSPENFSSTVELLITSDKNALSNPSPTGSTYRMYGVVPADLPQQNWRFFWDLWGFSGPTRGGSLYMENIKVYTN